MTKPIHSRPCKHCGASFVVAERPGARGFCSTGCRFWSKVDKSGGPDACWEWRGARLPWGTGQFRQPDGSLALASRVSLEWSTGRTLGPGACALHRCDNPPCVNPAHLFEGTRSDNSADMVAKGRSAAGDKNGARTKPWQRPSGDRHWSKTMPDAFRAMVARMRPLRGDEHPARRHPERVARGERVGGAKLTEADVQAIRARYPGASQRALAAEFGVNQTVIGDIVNRKSWRHVA